MEDTGSSLFVPDWISPEQFADRVRSDGDDLVALRRLMTALLDLSVRDLLRARRATWRKRWAADLARQRAEHAAEARRWVFKDDDGLFSFQTVCDVLGVDPASLRERISEMEAA